METPNLHQPQSPHVKAILCQRFGTADDLVLAEVPDPSPRPGELVAKVAAVGLNFFDTLIIAGKYQLKPPFPFSPGGEFAGVVEAVGEGVIGLQARRPCDGLHQLRRGCRTRGGQREPARRRFRPNSISTAQPH